MVATSSSVGSGAAGSATFVGSKSRKYNYFEPRGKRGTQTHCSQSLLEEG